MITQNELEALEILVKAGKVDPQVPWHLAVKQTGDYIVNLGKQIQEERQDKEER